MANGLTVQDQGGEALLFRNLTDAGAIDPLAPHAGLPVQAGTKWLATRWIRVATFDPWNAN
jgi:prolyl 4-hydroxylase